MSRVWIWGGLLTLCLSLVLGVTVVWVNIELVDLSYDLKVLQGDLDAKRELKAKLEVERNYLVAPSRLRQLAGEYGLKPAEPHQVRTLTR